MNRVDTKQFLPTAILLLVVMLWGCSSLSSKVTSPLPNHLCIVDNPMSSSIRRRSLLSHLTRKVVVPSTCILGLVGDEVFIKKANAEGSDLSNSRTTTTNSRLRMVKLASGVQFVEVRDGTGPPISEKDGNNDVVVLMHIRATTMDKKLVFDTREDGHPILHSFGSVQDFDYFGGDSSKRSKVTLGVEDAILSRGVASWEGGYGKVDPMREGGIRKAVVPARLAYGHSGVSRYDAFRMNLKQAIPRDEPLLYEIELLRCLDVEIEVPSINGVGERESRTVQACCSEENFPCNKSNNET